jgi:ectoine hydroxylase-related dioxygenase (phytanoyl-CoA dioxygenase family)
MLVTANPCSLTEEQIRFFDENGYLILRNWITGSLLERMQAAGREWMDQAAALHDRNETAPDFNYADREVGEVLFRVDYLHDKGASASLELLGSPNVLGVAESLCGPNFVPTYESMVLKQAGDGEAIRWHQDAVHPRRSRIYNFDLYLDRSSADGGALVVIPKSHHSVLEACELERLYGWSPPGSIVVEMEPGDVLLHDVMVVHGSPRIVGKALRRTIYYEFRAAEQILSEGPWDRDWVDRRLSLLPLALEAYRAAYPDLPQFQWHADAQYREGLKTNREEVLRVLHKVHTPGSHCSAGSVPM